MKIYDKIKDEKLQQNINRGIKTQNIQILKYLHYHQVKLIDFNNLQMNKYYHLLKVGLQNKISLVILLQEKQTKAIKEHEKQLIEKWL